MLDRRRRADLEGAQALGRLSDEMVFSLGRAVRAGGDHLPEEVLEIFRRGALLFDVLASDDEVLPEQQGGMMFEPSGYLDALQVVQHRLNNDQLEEYAGRVARLLRTIVDRGCVASDEIPLLETLRDLFAELGEATLVRASELSLRQEAQWPPLRHAI